MDTWLGNFWLLTLLIWPSVLIVSALLNMLVSWAFSWQELVTCHIMGFLSGVCFYYGTVDPNAVPAPEVGHLAHFFLMAATGLFGLLKWIGVDALQDRATFFWFCAYSTAIATTLSAALDRVAAQVIGYDEKVGRTLWSVLVFGLKAPFGLITTVVGFLIGMIGLGASVKNSKGGFSFIGGVFVSEWGAGSSTDYHATTFSSYVNIFRGGIKDVMTHELYHTRQYIYMQDWLGLFYFTFAALWGVISSAIHAAGSGTFDAGMAFDGDGEVGNPIEIAAHKLSW
ncbi:MAG: hypothetical protein AB7O52_07520 [Planctomycetota bacterium]